MLRGCVIAVGVLLLLAGLGVSAATSRLSTGLVAIIGGVLVLVGTVSERWRYRTGSDMLPGPEWQDTGERFEDPPGGDLTGVFFNPRTGERRYVKLRRD